MATRLLALDLDGTLVQPDGSIAPADLAAITRARSAGVAITLATGRLAAGTLPTAHALGLDAPVICADGALVVAPRSGEVLDVKAIDHGRTQALLETFVGHALAAFVFSPDAIHGDEPRADRHERLRGWTPTLMLHPRLADATAWQTDPVLLALGVGDQVLVDRAAEALSQPEDALLSCACFPLGDEWAVRLRRADCSKATGLARVAAALGIDPGEVAAVGDWLNDIEMLGWAPRSFAMPHAPDAVKSAATDVLAQGGVAEAIARWLGW